MKRTALSLQERSQGKLLTEAFQIFRRVKVNNNISEKTIIHFDTIMKVLESFYEDVSKVYCSEITTDTVEEFIEFLKERNPKIRATSINSYLKDLRTFLYYCMDRGYLKPFKIKRLREDRIVKEVYTPDEISRLIEKPNLKKTNFSEYRNWVMTCYLLATGNRLGTVCDLRVKDIDFQNSMIHLRKVKTRKAYNMPLSVTLEKILREYLEYRKGEGDDYLFCNRYGARLQESSLNTAIGRYNQRRGVAKTSIHLYRNTFAKNYLTSGGDLARLQKLLCHSTPTMSLRYAEMYDTDLDYHFNERNPLDSHMREFGSGKVGIKMKK
ncbi:MAG: tyrosine-type recombinase/integrase [Oscillospiraceae bacterium]|nr:tyrosine-type recombinase/integrase [Oscillospiraceae bacterium]